MVLHGELFTSRSDDYGCCRGLITAWDHGFGRRGYRSPSDGPRLKRTYSVESNFLSTIDFTEVTGKKSKRAHLKLQSSELLENSQSAS